MWILLIDVTKDNHTFHATYLSVMLRGKVKSASTYWAPGTTGYKEMETKLPALEELPGRGDPIYINSKTGSIIHWKNKHLKILSWLELFSKMIGTTV